MTEQSRSRTCSSSWTLTTTVTTKLVNDLPMLCQSRPWKPLSDFQPSARRETRRTCTIGRTMDNFRIWSPVNSAWKAYSGNHSRARKHFHELLPINGQLLMHEDNGGGRNFLTRILEGMRRDNTLGTLVFCFSVFTSGVSVGLRYGAEGCTAERNHMEEDLPNPIHETDILYFTSDFLTFFLPRNRHLSFMSVI